MKFNKRLKFIIILGIICIIALYICTQKNGNPPKGTFQFGISDSSGNIISSGYPLNSKFLEDGFNLNIQQNLYEPREYLVLIFVDYKQENFTVNSSVNNSFYMELDSKDSIKIPINLKVSPDARELSIIIIRKPDFMVEKDDYDRAIKTEDILCLRYPLNNDGNDIRYSNINYQISENQLGTRVFLSEEVENLKLLTVKNSGDIVYLSLGNTQDKVVDYAVIALQNWIQVDIECEQVQFFEVEAGTHIYFEMELPKVYEESNYQILVFPNPYKVNPKEPLTTFTFGTNRIHLFPYEDNTMTDKIENSSFSEDFESNLLELGIDKNMDGKISRNEVMEIKELNLSRRNLKDITGIKHFINLEKLYLDGNKISNYDELKKLDKLTTLDVSRFKLDSNQDFKNIKSLKILYLNLCDISELDNLIPDKIEELHLSGNRLISIDPLVDIKNLKILYCDNNLIDDISVLKFSNELHKLDIRNNLINDLSVLENIPILKVLIVDENQYETMNNLGFIERLNSNIKIEVNP